jgi:hypothetical protein
MLVLEEKSLRLLRAMRDHQAVGRPDVMVSPTMSLLMQAGIKVADRDAAMRWLIDREALERDPPKRNELASSYSDYREPSLYFFITVHGLERLREAGLQAAILLEARPSPQ